jgi:hypothetical protein
VYNIRVLRLEMAADPALTRSQMETCAWCSRAGWPELHPQAFTGAEVADGCVGWLNDPEVNRCFELCSARQTRETRNEFFLEPDSYTDGFRWALLRDEWKAIRQS